MVRKCSGTKGNNVIWELKSKSFYGNSPPIYVEYSPSLFYIKKYKETFLPQSTALVLENPRPGYYISLILKFEDTSVSVIFFLGPSDLEGLPSIYLGQKSHVLTIYNIEEEKV
jgi:hypothetical protein